MFIEKYVWYLFLLEPSVIILRKCLKLVSNKLILLDEEENIYLKIMYVLF